MNKYFFTLLTVVFVSCNAKHKSILEMNFTSRNIDTFQEVKSLFLNSLTERKKPIGFSNIKCSSPNKFIFKDLEKGLYIGLLTIEKENRVYNISIDSIAIKEGKNIITKELNLGTVKLPE